MKSKLMAVLVLSLSLASFLAKAKWGYLGFHDGV
jgi:hypothetical protein